MHRNRSKQRRNSQGMETTNRDARRLAELFRGRFSETVAAQMIQDKGSLGEALNFVLTGDSVAVQGYLNQNQEYVDRLRQDSQNVQVIECEERQFSCEGCVLSWWKKVPTRKMVSKCNKCHTKYDPIPRDKEWGWGEFICQCGRQFRGCGIMGVTQSCCYKCKSSVFLDHISPPRKRLDGPPRKSPQHHNCNGINCYNRNEFAFAVSQEMPDANGWVLTRGRSRRGHKPCECIHPLSPNVESHQIKKIYYASSVHQSTGSTIDTFLSSTSLDSRDKSVAFSLETIHENELI